MTLLLQALPSDLRAPDDVALLDAARRNQWRRCPQCHHMIELYSGCRHITCKCGCEFCYTCGVLWEKVPGGKSLQKCEWRQRVPGGVQLVAHILLLAAGPCDLFEVPPAVHEAA